MRPSAISIFFIIFLVSFSAQAYALNAFQGDAEHFLLKINIYDADGNVESTFRLQNWYDTARFTYSGRSGEVEAQYYFILTRDMVEPFPQGAADPATSSSYRVALNITIFAEHSRQYQRYLYVDDLPSSGAEKWINFATLWDAEFYNNTITPSNPLTFVVVRMWWEWASDPNASDWEPVPVEYGGQLHEYTSPHWLVYAQYSGRGVYDNIIDVLTLFSPALMVYKIYTMSGQLPDPYAAVSGTLYDIVTAAITNFIANMVSSGLSLIEQYVIVIPVSTFNKAILIAASNPELAVFSVLLIVGMLGLWYITLSLFMWVLDHIPIVG